MSEEEISTFDEATVTAISSRIQTALAPAIAEEVRKALTGEKRDMAAVAEATVANQIDAVASHAAKKVRKENAEFKKKGNENQWRHTKDVLDEVEAAMEAVEKRDADLATEKLTEGKKILKKRLKLIKLADREEHGWNVVRHYESDELASDSEDEKSIGRARKAAAADDKKKREKMSAKAKRQKSQNNFTRTRYGNYAYGHSTYKKPTVCFKCNKEGHMQRECYSTKAGSSRSFFK